MPEHPNATLVRRLYDAINANDDFAPREIFAPGMVRHDLQRLDPAQRR